MEQNYYHRLLRAASTKPTMTVMVTAAATATAAAVTAAAATGATAAGVHSFNFQRFHNICVLNSNNSFWAADQRDDVL